MVLRTRGYHRKPPGTHSSPAYNQGAVWLDEVKGEVWKEVRSDRKRREWLEHGWRSKQL
jgi:hypothetical protein